MDWSKKKRLLILLVGFLLAIVGVMLGSVFYTFPDFYAAPIAPTSAWMETMTTARLHAGLTDADDYYAVRIVMDGRPERAHLPAIDGVDVEYFMVYPASQYYDTTKSDYVLELWVPKDQGTWSSSLRVTYGESEFTVSCPNEDFKERRVTYSNKWSRINMWRLLEINAESKDVVRSVPYSVSTMAFDDRVPEGALIAYPSGDAQEVLVVQVTRS